MNFLTHNGVMTIQSKRTGEHRTIRCKTERFADGSEHRVVSLLTGVMNDADYTGFATVRSGKINVWRKYRESEVLRWLAACAADPDKFRDQAEVLVAGTCRRCGRPLTTPGSIKSGIGPICAEKE